MGSMHESKTLDITMASWARLVIVGLVVLVAFLVRDTLLAILTSIVIASAIEPAARWAKRNGVPRLPAVISIYLLLVVVLAALFYFLFLPLIGEVAGFIRTLNVYSNAALNGGVLSEMFEKQEVFGNLKNSIISVNDLSTHLNSLAGFFSKSIFSSVSFIFGGLVSFLLIVVLSFYLAVQEDGVGKFLRIVTPYKHEKYIVDVWKRSQTKIGLWMQGQLLLSSIIAILTYLGLTLLGIENALLLAVLAGIFELIPLFGPILAAIPAMLVAFASGGTPDLLLVGGFYLIIQQFENHLIHPLVVKKVIGVPPIISIIALVLGGQLAGFIGILIAVPVAAIIMELLSDYEKEKSAKHSSAQNVA